MNLNRKQFWTGVTILLSNYHSVNRKLFACLITKVEKVFEHFHRPPYNSNELHTRREELDKSLLISTILLQLTKDENATEPLEGMMVHFKCIPKKNGDSVKAVGFIDFSNCSYKMIFESNTIADFEIKLDGELIVNMINKKPGIDIDLSLRWRDFQLIPKFCKWCLQEDYSSNLKNNKSSSNTSLRLIDIEKYNQRYNMFKQKYSKIIKKLWKDANESTDPLKFIYEDLAIAAYLITLWESDLVSESPATFADLGCGNGLLVYILIEEGYKGYGYDVRSRKLWTLYPAQITSNLYEEVVEPFKFNLPAEVNWLIGNHSDELSPWIPVLAAISHKHINYFLLPCCAFEFSGNKFQRRNSSISGYNNFCDYVEEISNICGFETKKDRLKIPSTKRNALIGLNRRYNDKDFLAGIKIIKDFVQKEQYEHANSSIENIKLRAKVEAVRNCTQVKKSVIDGLVEAIFFLLLETSSNCVDVNVNKTNWQTGGRLTLAQIARSLDREKLKQIKSECGGLKTLLRNKHEIFQFQHPDLVLIRKPQHQLNTSKPQTIKKRICFFKLHHPQGCPLMDNECTFLH